MFNYPQDIRYPARLLRSFGSINVSDDAYPWLIRNFAPVGIKGLSFAALAAAVISSLASMLNSTSTIFTMDIYKQHIKKDATDKQLVRIGRLTAFLALVIAIIAVEPLLGDWIRRSSTSRIFRFHISRYHRGLRIGTSLKRASSKAAIWTSILTIPMGVLFKIALPDMPFQFRMGYIFIILFFIFVAITYVDNSRIAAEKATGDDRRKMLKWARFTLFFAVLFILSAAIHKILLVGGSSNELIIYLENIGFEAFFFLDH